MQAARHGQSPDLSQIFLRTNEAKQARNATANARFSSREAYSTNWTQDSSSVAYDFLPDRIFQHKSPHPDPGLSPENIRYIATLAPEPARAAPVRHTYCTARVSLYSPTDARRRSQRTTNSPTPVSSPTPRAPYVRVHTNRGSSHIHKTCTAIMCTLPRVASHVPPKCQQTHPSTYNVCVNPPARNHTGQLCIRAHGLGPEAQRPSHGSSPRRTSCALRFSHAAAASSLLLLTYALAKPRS